MRHIILFGICLCAACGLSCFRAAQHAPPGQSEAEISYWLAQMKGVDPHILSAEQQKQKEEILTRAWRELVAAGQPAAAMIRQELEANQDDAYFQLSASMVLYQIERAAAHPAIVKALRRTSIQDNPFQYFYLCHRLARSGDDAVLPSLGEFLANRKALFIDKDSPTLEPGTICIYLYGAYGPRAIPALAKACSAQDAAVRSAAAAVLGYFGDDEPLFVLADLLGQGPDEAVRAAAANALGQTDHLAAIRPLTRALTTDKSANVRAACAYALGELQHDGCVDGLAIALNDLSQQVRQYAINSLEYVATERCAAIAANRLAIEEDRTVRLALIKALGALGYEKWLPLLQRISEKGSRAETEAASESIKRIVALGPRGREPYSDLEGEEVSPAELTRIIDELCKKYGEGIDQYKKTIFLSAGKEGLPQLEKLRCRALWIVNDDTMDRVGEISKLIRLVKRKIRKML